MGAVITAQLSSRIQSPGRETATTGETAQDSEGEGEKHGFSLPFSLPSPSNASHKMSPAGSQLIREPGKYNLNIIRPLRHLAEQRKGEMLQKINRLCSHFSVSPISAPSH